MRRMIPIPQRGKRKGMNPTAIRITLTMIRAKPVSRFDMRLRPAAASRPRHKNVAANGSVSDEEDVGEHEGEEQLRHSGHVASPAPRRADDASRVAPSFGRSAVRRDCPPLVLSNGQGG